MDDTAARSAAHMQGFPAGPHTTGPLGNTSIRVASSNTTKNAPQNLLAFLWTLQASPGAKHPAELRKASKNVQKLWVFASTGFSQNPAAQKVIWVNPHHVTWPTNQ